MKIIIFTLILLVLPIRIMAQQSAVIIDSEEYQQRKISGTLSEVNLIYPNFEILSSQNNSHSNVGNLEKSGGCDCYITPDASYTLAIGPSDDGSTASIALPFTFNLYGQMYTSLFINNNGNISFANALASFSPTAFPSAGPKIVAPFWGDVDTRNGNGQVFYKITPTAIYINWEDVGYFNVHGDLRNTFQLIISDGTDPSIPDGNNVAFCYQDMQWTTGDASNGFNGFPDLTTPPFYYATCGTNKGDNISFFQLAQFGHPGTDFDGSMGNDDGISWLDNKHFYFSTAIINNVPPVIVEQIDCDTIYIGTWGIPVIVPITVLSPESNQLNTITYDDGGLNCLEVLSLVNGNTSNVEFQISATDADNGIYDITVFAQDDYSAEPGFSQYTFTVIIDIDCNVSDVPHAVYSQDNSVIQINENVIFTETSCGVPMTWSWIIEPGIEGQDWEFINGTDASSANPEVHFMTFGIYSSALVVGNTYGTDSVYHANSITVLGIPGSCDAASMLGCFDTANNPYISAVKIGSYVNNSACSEYSDYSFQSIPAYRDSSYVLEINSSISGIGSDTLSNEHIIGVWIDWNQNDSYENANEFIGLTNNQFMGVSTINIQIPSLTLLGNVGMRIRLAKVDTVDISSCDLTLYGEVEDYILEIKSALSIDEMASLKDIVLFPNPTTDNLYLSGIVNEIEVELLDIKGNIVLERVKLTSTNNGIQINHLKNGIYFIRLFTANESTTRRFIKK